MGVIFFEIVIVVLLVMLNGVFAMAEMAIVSVRKARLRHLADEGDRLATMALEIANDPSRLLATVQIGITLIGILAGVFGGATITEQTATALGSVPVLSGYADTIAIGIVVIVITVLSLVLGELVPKRLALSNAERIAIFLSPSMRLASRMSRPLVWMLDAAADSIIHLMGMRPSPEPAVTPEEIKVLVEQGAESGVFEESEQDMIQVILELDERRISSLMIPRTRIVWLDRSDSMEIIATKIMDTQFSRFPVCQGSLDTPLGFVRARDLLNQCVSGQGFDPGRILRKPLFVPETMSILAVLEQFRQHSVHLALVVDEYGSIQGMVTHNDILETIAGCTHSKSSGQTPSVTKREDGSWLIDGLLSIEEMKAAIGIRKLPSEDEERYQTIGGFVMDQLGTVPTEGQSFVLGNLRFEVIDMDGRRIDKILVTRVPDRPAES